ncbi:MAG TPA: elongation factor P maturation arginine rhamnosyltransferase EarP [Ramlibacter sp.]|nr:elongation factor P maturation arginine rhamnosyltransferase EarP [Ramlibacter sp.]
MLWDIFCKVIDNHGDIGVCWRLSVQLAERGESVRLWVDDASALDWMAPAGHPGVQVLAWHAQATAQPGEVVIEAFGCELEPPLQAALARRSGGGGRQPAWINLEYLTAESFAERNHRLPSPLLSGPAAGLTRHFFYPGFTARTGGLLREPDLLRRQSEFKRDAWLQAQGIAGTQGARLVSLFCYEPPALEPLLAQWARGPRATHLLVTAGRATAALRAALKQIETHAPAWNSRGLLSISCLPLLSQPDFDHLLWACDLNFVRGEDSLVRALWAGKPLVWQIYPQHDNAHHRKLEAFLAWLNAPPDMREFHRAWNGIGGELPVAGGPSWSACIRDARDRLLAQPDLLTQLLQFAVDDLQAAP